MSALSWCRSKSLLKPWAEKYGALVGSLDAHCMALDDEDLQALADATKTAHQQFVRVGNFDVAPLVAERVEAERMRRASITARADAGSDRG